MIQVYNCSSKFELSKIFIFMRDSISANDKSKSNDVIHSSIKLMTAKPTKILHRYHYQLLNDIFKSNSFGSQSLNVASVEHCIKEILLSTKSIKNHHDPLLHQVFLKLLLSIFRYYWIMSKLSDPMLEIIFEWFSTNVFSFLDKYFFKLFNLILEKGNDISKFCENILMVLKEKGYQNIILRNNRDIFIDLNSSTVLILCQAQALEIVLKIITLSVPLGYVNRFNKIVFDFPPPNVDVVHHYIKSLLVDDDILLLSNLIAVTRLHETLLSHTQSIKLEDGLHTYLLMLTCAPYWFSYFLTYLNFDHKIVIDWLLDNNKYCQEYLKVVLPYISNNFILFVDFFGGVNQTGATLENMMDFIIRLNLNIRDINNCISCLIDEVEKKYELLGNDLLTTDPLDSVLSMKFSSNCNIGEIETCNVENNTFPLVSYSDSD